MKREPREWKKDLPQQSLEETVALEVGEAEAEMDGAVEVEAVVAAEVEDLEEAMEGTEEEDGSFKLLVYKDTKDHITGAPKLFLMVRVDSNCPKLCKLGNTKVGCIPWNTALAL